MENKKCDCSQCVHWDECEIGIILHKPITSDMFGYRNISIKAVDFAPEAVEIKKGDKIAQITLTEHKSYLFGIETDTERAGGFGSTGK